MSRLGKYTPEAAKAARIAEEANKGGGDFYKFENGDNILRFLPPIDGNPEPWVTVTQHFHKKEDGSFVVFNCPKRMANAACPLCAKADRESDYEAKKPYLPTTRSIGLVVNLRAEDPKIQPIGFGQMIKDRLRYFIENRGIDFTDAKTGREVIIAKSGQGLKTEYMTDLGDPMDLTEWPRLDEALETAPDLKTYLAILPYDTIVEKLTATAGPALGAPTGMSARAIAAASAAKASASPSTRVRRAPVDAAPTEVVGALDDVDDSELPF